MPNEFIEQAINKDPRITTDDDLEVEFWKHVLFNKPPFLNTLRTIVLQQNAKRCPKWRFRVAQDLVMQMQPRPRGPLFVGMAVQGTEVPADIFKRNYSDLCLLEYVEFFEFTIRADSYLSNFFSTWSIHPEHLLFRPKRLDRYKSGLVFKHRVIDKLRRFDNLDAVEMFQPNCLICGRPLTDPISMARWIGPECAGKTNFDARNHTLVNSAADEQAA